MSTTTTGTTIPLWATDATGWPIYDAPDADGVAERLQLNARGQVVTAAGTVIPCNAEGLPMDGPTATSNEIPQPNMGIRYHDFRTSLATIAFAGITAPPATGLVPGAGSVLPPPPRPMFALNPGQVTMTTIIDYSSSEGQRVFREATKSLFSESNKFALNADRIQSFLQTLKARGSLNGWNFDVSTGTTARGGPYKNLVDSYGELTLEQIRFTVEHEIQGRNIRRRQTDNMMHACILASLTEQAAAVVFLKINEYKAPNGEDSGLLLLKLVISESTLETKSTVNHLWGKLTTGLPGIMAGHSNNIQLFNRDVKVIQEDLRARGQNPDNILPQLFSTYYSCEGTNSPLGRFIEFLENSYNSGVNLTANDLMFKVEEKYKELKERQLVQGAKKDDDIIALKAELESIKKTPKRNSSGETGGESNKQKKTKWMFVKPKDGEPKSKKVGDKDYHWCDGKDDSHKPKWVRHHPRDCGRREQGTTTTTAAPAAAPAPAASASGSQSGPSWTTVMMATLADHE
jgi:hypothetical protein